MCRTCMNVGEYYKMNLQFLKKGSAYVLTHQIKKLSKLFIFGSAYFFTSIDQTRFLVGGELVGAGQPENWPEGGGWGLIGGEK